MKSAWRQASSAVRMASRAGSCTRRSKFVISSNGEVTAQFCALRVRPTAGRGERWLLCERSATAERTYYLVHLAATPPLVDLVALARSRWPIEQQYRELKDDLGLDHFEGRTYPGWTHHVVLTAVAFTFLQIERARWTEGPRPTLPVVRGWVREIMDLLYVLHNRRCGTLRKPARLASPLQADPPAAHGLLASRLPRTTATC